MTNPGDTTMPRFYVVHGYESPDRCTRSGGQPVLKITECENPSEVVALKVDHEQIASSCDVSHATFRVFEGERMMVEKERVTEWELGA